MIWVIIALAAVLALLCGALAFANGFVNQSGVPRLTRRVRFNKDDRILYVVAHPDDEVLMSGTLSLLKRKYGLPVKALYLTHGEDGPTYDLVPKSGLKERRTQELGQVKTLLALDEMVVCDYPDRYLANQDFDAVCDTVRREAEAFSPTYVFTFDENIGMYGHTDHVAAGKAAAHVAKQTDSIKGVFQMTLPGGMLALALKLSKTFRERYDPARGLPRPNVAANIYRWRGIRYAVTRAHETQTAVMRELQPYYDKLPRWLYYAIFDREYFYYREKSEL
ncbi:MAG: PIG-L family deacetylase [Clostridiales bacterium]|nr:PIG-L family deacetylase [Clostridiales bacterium]